MRSEKLIVNLALRIAAKGIATEILETANVLSDQDPALLGEGVTVMNLAQMLLVMAREVMTTEAGIMARRKNRVPNAQQEHPEVSEKEDNLLVKTLRISPGDGH